MSPGRGPADDASGTALLAPVILTERRAVRGGYVTYLLPSRLAFSNITFCHSLDPSGRR